MAALGADGTGLCLRGLGNFGRGPSGFADDAVPAGGRLGLCPQFRTSSHLAGPPPMARAPCARLGTSPCHPDKGQGHRPVNHDGLYDVGAVFLLCALVRAGNHGGGDELWCLVHPVQAQPATFGVMTADHRDSSWRRARCHALWQHQGGLCFHCGCAMPDPLTQRARHRKRLDSATIDHVFPRALGGLAEWVNEVAACRSCNAAKADRMPGFVELWRLLWLKRETLLPYIDTAPDCVAVLREQKKAPAEAGAQV